MRVPCTLALVSWQSTRDIEPSRQGQNSRTTRCLGCSCADVPTRVSWSGVRADVNVAPVRVASEMFQFVTFCVVVAETLFRLSTRTCPSLPRPRSCRYGDYGQMTHRGRQIDGDFELSRTGENGAASWRRGRTALGRNTFLQETARCNFQHAARRC